MDDNDKVQKAVDHLQALVRGLVIENKALRSELRSPEQIEDAIIEFANATAERGNFDWAEDDSKEYFDRSPERRAAWSLIVTRCSNAESAMRCIGEQIIKARAERKVA